MTPENKSNYITAFIKLNAKEKLSVIADFTTILGISVATFVAGPFLSELAGLGFDISEFIWALFFYSAIGLLAIGLVIGFLSEFKSTEEEKSSGDVITPVFVYLFIFAIFFSVYPWTKNFFGDITNNRYLLPPSAISAIDSIDSLSIDNIGKTQVIKGKVKFKKNAKFDEYLVLLYVLDNSSGIYRYHQYKFGEYSVSLNRSGEFSIPVKNEVTSKDLYIVIYRELDSSRTLGDSFPNDVTQIPSLTMEEYGVFSEKLDFKLN